MSEYYKSQIYFLNKDYKRALSTSQKLLKRDDVDPLYTAEANRIAGESLYNMGDIVSAIPYLQSYVDAVESPLPTTRYILGVSQYKNHEYTQAIESLEGVVGEDNAMGQGAYLLIGQSLLKKKDHQAAMLALNKAVKMDHDLEMQELAFYNYAVASSQGGVIPFGNSVANFEEFLRRFPNSPFAPKVQEYVVTGYMADNNYEQALKSIEEIKKPSTNILKAKQRVLYTLGARDFAQNKVDQAILALGIYELMYTETPSIVAINEAIELSKKYDLGYAVDVYPFYGSDASAALRAGHDIQAALIGPGVHASHGVERTHIDGCTNTMKLLHAYLTEIKF